MYVHVSLITDMNWQIHCGMLGKKKTFSPSGDISDLERFWHCWLADYPCGLLVACLPSSLESLIFYEFLSEVYFWVKYLSPKKKQVVEAPTLCILAAFWGDAAKCYLSVLAFWRPRWHVARQRTGESYRSHATGAGLLSRICHRICACSYHVLVPVEIDWENQTKL